MSASPPVVWSYRVEHDVGLAPNPFGGVCTLAVCKPAIRRKAQAGDLIIGMNSAERRRRLNPHAPVFVMEVAERLRFDEYWADPRFADKKPVPDAGSVWQAGDNIYHQDAQGWVQAPSWHSLPHGGVSAANLRSDTATSQHVLIGSRFAYWGPHGPTLPDALQPFVKIGRGEQDERDPQVVAAFVDWAEPLLALGRVNWPTAWGKRGRPLARLNRSFGRDFA